MLVSIYFNLLLLLLTPVFGVFIVQLCVLFNFCFCCIVHSCSRQNTPATAGSRSLLNFNIFVFLFCCICGYSDEPSHRDAVPPPSTFSVETAHNYSTSMQGWSAKRICVGTAFPHQIKRKTAPNSSNKVSIRLQAFPHWIFLFHCSATVLHTRQLITSFMLLQALQAEIERKNLNLE